MANRPELTLDPANWESLRRLGHQMVDDMLAYIKDIRQQPVWQPVPERTRAYFEEDLPFRPQDPAQVYAEFKQHILPYPTGNIHPRFWGWVMGSGTPVGALADMLASFMNANVCLGDQAAIEVEKQVLKWCKQLLEYPDAASGILTSGASMANLTALLVARNFAVGKSIRRMGLQKEPSQMVIYCSTETHNCIQKAAEAIGLGSSAVRKVPVDEHFRIRTDLLEKFIKNDLAGGHLPFCIVGNAGTVNTGAIDPLGQMLRISRKYKIWFHIDGAFGALAKGDKEYAERLKVIEEADSVAFDLHKWLYLPYDVGCVLVRHAEAHLETFDQAPNYLLQMERGASAGTHSFGDYGLELSRGFRALKVWMSMKTYGVFSFLGMLRQNITQARYLADKVAEHAHLELLAPVEMNIVCFRYVRSDCSAAELQAINREVLMRLQEEGIATVSATVLNGRFALRAAITNHRTRLEDLDLLQEAVARIGDEIAEDTLFLI